MNILIENGVALNNGDAALIFSIGKEFEKKGDIVFYSTFNYDNVKKKYPEKNWIKSPLTNKIITKIPIVNKFYFIILLFFSPFYRKIDAIVSAPGGYINSLYGIKKKLLLLNSFHKVLRKPIYMYSQSIGHLSEKDQALLKKYIKDFSLFYVRDSSSRDRISKIGYFDNVYQTKDAAFLLPINKIRQSEKNTKKIGISVREWVEIPSEIKNFKNNIKHITKYLLKKGYEIKFISTCQGEKEYIDDSKIAKEIVEELSDCGVDTRQIHVDESSNTLDQFIDKLDEFDFVIGTRLHMCILSMVNGIPAFNISYEEKGRECFKYLGIQNYSVAYGEKNEKLLESLEQFLLDTNFQSVFDKIEVIHEESQLFFDKMHNDIVLKKERNL